MKYYICIEETRTVAVGVDADSKEEAINKVSDAYYKYRISMDGAVVDTDFTKIDNFSEDDAEYAKAIGVSAYIDISQE